MSLEIDPKEFFYQTIGLFKETLNVNKRVAVNFTFDLLLVYLNYRPSCTLNHRDLKIEVHSEDVVKVLNKKYPNVFKLFKHPITNSYFIWCHKKPRNPQNLEKKLLSIEQYIYTGEILGYSDPGGLILDNPDNHRFGIHYELVLDNPEKNKIYKYDWLSNVLSNLNKVNNKDFINFNNVARSISDTNKSYIVTQTLIPNYYIVGLKGWITHRIEHPLMSEEVKFLNITYNGRKENMKKSIMLKLYDILVNKWYKNQDNSGDIIKLTEEDIKLIKKCYFKIFVFKKQQDGKHLVKVNPKYYHEL